MRFRELTRHFWIIKIRHGGSHFWVWGFCEGKFVKREADEMGQRRTVINSIFIKVRIERGVIIFIVGVVRVGRVLEGIRMRVLKRNEGHR
jgi:hypothetical protein